MGRREDSRASVHQRPKADWRACGDRHGDRILQSLDPPSLPPPARQLTERPLHKVTAFLSQKLRCRL